MEVNKSTRKYHFPLPFIDQVLDTLSGKHYFSFLYDFHGYNQIQIHPDDQDKNTFTCPWGKFSYKVLPFGLCNAPTTFQRVVLSIFYDFVHDKMEIYMDDFTPYGDTFDQALTKLDKVLHRSIEMNLCLSNEKSLMLSDHNIVLGHHIYNKGIEVDSAKLKNISDLPSPQTEKDVRRFIGHEGFYHSSLNISANNISHVHFVDNRFIFSMDKRMSNNF